MKIFLIGVRLQEDNMERHVLDALRELGHEVEFFALSKYVSSMPKVNRIISGILGKFVRESERIHEKKIVRSVSRFSPDMVLVLLGNQLSPKTLSLIKKTTHAPVVCWCQDQLSTLGRQFVLSGEYDLVFMKDKYMVSLFNSMVKDNHIYLPEACNPSVHYHALPPANQLDEYSCDITTAATLYYYRQSILKHLDNYQVKVWGSLPVWLDYKLNTKHTKKYVVGESKRFAFSSAKIVLNTLHYAEIDSVNCRLFEVAGCGGFQLTSHKDIISDYFEIDKEIVTFKNINELIEKVEYYLSNDLLRNEIASKAMIRAHSEHSYTVRLNKLISHI